MPPMPVSRTIAADSGWGSAEKLEIVCPTLFPESYRAAERSARMI